MIRVIETAGYWKLKAPGSIHGSLYYPRDGRWQFNGDFANPTFSPSVKESWNTPEGAPQCNHFIVTDGKVFFCADCTHSLAGQTLELAEFGEAEVEMAKDE